MATSAVIYCRISDDRTGRRMGVKRQEPDCRGFAASRGIDVAEVLIDNDLTAFKGKVRPAYRQLLEQVKDGSTKTVIVDHLDRLYRNTRELEELIDLVEATQVKVLTVTGGDYDLNTTDGRAVARIVVALAQKESEDKSRRIRRKHLELAEAGAVVGGGRPFGYEADRRTIREDDAAHIREAAERVLLGESLRAICSDWNERGIAPPKAHHWRTTALRRILISARIAGLRSYQGSGTTPRVASADVTIAAKAVWPAIIDEGTWRRVRALLADPSRQTNGGFGARSYLLTGFLFCHKCGTRLIARPHRNRQRTYVCASGPGTGGCGGLRIKADPLEELVFEMVVYRFESPEFDDALGSSSEADEQDAVLRAIAEDEAQLQDLASEWADKTISKAEWLVARVKIERRLERTRKALAKSRNQTVLAAVPNAEALRASWPTMSLDRKRAVLAAVLDRIVIGPGRPGGTRFDPGRAHPVWRP